MTQQKFVKDNSFAMTLKDLGQSHIQSAQILTAYG